MHTSLRCFFCLLFLLTSLVQAEIITTGDVDPKDTGDWTGSTSLKIGVNSEGFLAVNNGSELTVGQGTIGDSGTATGAVTISDSGSTWNCNGPLTVGNQGTGQLDILDQGAVNSLSGILGNTSTGTTTVSGMGSAWSVFSSLTVGNLGHGVLDITDGGKVFIRNFQNLPQGLIVDMREDRQSFIKISAGGMLCIWGDADDSLDAFLDLIKGDDPIRWYNPTLGAWDSLTSATLGTDCTLGYSAGYTILTVESEEIASLPGDANRDGIVNGSDASILANHWQTTGGATWGMGDFNGDGAVNGSDASILANHWQATSSPPDDNATVPEPGTVVMLLFGLLALGFRRYIK